MNAVIYHQPHIVQYMINQCRSNPHLGDILVTRILFVWDQMVCREIQLLHTAKELGIHQSSL